MTREGGREKEGTSWRLRRFVTAPPRKQRAPASAICAPDRAPMRPMQLREFPARRVPWRSSRVDCANRAAPLGQSFQGSYAQLLKMPRLESGKTHSATKL